MTMDFLKRMDSETAFKALIGAALGAAFGSVVAKQAGKGAAIGGAVGAAMGGTGDLLLKSQAAPKVVPAAAGLLVGNLIGTAVGSPLIGSLGGIAVGALFGGKDTKDEDEEYSLSDQRKRELKAQLRQARQSGHAEARLHRYTTKAQRFSDLASRASGRADDAFTEWDPYGSGS